MQGPKYKRRWVELTGQTLVYAATQQDLLAGKVFAVREMKWVKADGDNKFQVRCMLICFRSCLASPPMQPNTVLCKQLKTSNLLLYVPQVRFPERVLTFKVEYGGKNERDTWVEALEQAKQQGAEAGRRGGSAEKLEQLKKVSSLCNSCTAYIASMGTGIRGRG
jgi:hypothetical protein